MPDISMCHNNEKCKKRETCYRNIAAPDIYQYYSEFYKESQDLQKECAYYWEVKSKKFSNDPYGDKLEEG